MAKPLDIKQHDTATPVVISLVDGKGKAFTLDPVWPITFAMKPAEPGMPGPTFKKAAQFVSANGQARYFFDAADVAVAGAFKAECEVMTPTGPQTFPRTYWDVIIRPDIG